MTNLRMASEIKFRFESERDNIIEFVDFLRVKTKIVDSKINELRGTLREYGLPDLYARPLGRFNEVFDQDEIDTLLSSMDELTPVINGIVVACRRKQDDWRPVFGSGSSIKKHPDLYYGWIDYLVEDLPSEFTQEELEKLLEYYTRQAMYDIDPADYSREDVLNAINDALDEVILIKIETKINALTSILDTFGEIRLIARASTPIADINVLRQGFILLMTIFDAAIFDLARLKFTRNFFSMLEIFARDESVKYKAIASMKSFEEFRDRTIEEQLKKRYLKDILLMLNKAGVAYFDASVGDSFGHLIELVLRRNVHIHNRGVVGERYFERGQASQPPRYNIYGLSLGDTAPIDELYWKRSIRLCSGCVARVAEWSES